MDELLIAKMRSRIERTRRIILMAHDPRMVRMLEDMVEQAEADLKKAEAGNTR